MRLLLDEHLEPAIAEQLRARGHDAIAVAAEPALRGMADAQLFEWATTQDRAIATYDAQGFVPLLTDRATIGEEASGLVLISSRAYPREDRSIGPLIRDLAKVLDENPARNALNGRAIWLGGPKVEEGSAG